MPKKPLISIITPSLNRAGMIETAIESVLAQDYPHFEHIIVDGGSTDGTLDVLVKYPHLKVFSGQDSGMYDAINKGLDLCTGEVIGFLNSDDCYAEHAFAKIASAFKEDVLAVAGGAVIYSENDNGEKQVVMSFSPKGKDVLELATTGSPFFNAWFFRRSVFDRIGKFNVQYQIAGDREFMLRFALSELKHIFIDQPVYHYRYHFGSLTFDINDRKFEGIVREHIIITEKYLQQRGLSPKAHELLTRSRTLDTTEMAFRCVKSKKLAKSWYYLVAGISYDWTWPLHLGYCMLNYVLTKFGKSTATDF